MDPKQNPLDKVLDADNRGVSKHLGQIANRMSGWEGRIAEELGLEPAEIAAIKLKHHDDLPLQA